MKSKYVEEFKRSLTAQSVGFEYSENESSSNVKFTQKLKSGADLIIVVSFGNSDFDIFINGIVLTNVNPMKKYIYEVLNELNCATAFVKYTLEKNRIAAHMNIPVKNNFNNEVVLDSIQLMLHYVNKDYSVLKKAAAL